MRRCGTDAPATLLHDRSTDRNIIRASLECEQLGDGYRPYDEILVAKIADRYYGTIEPRVVKGIDKQVWRTKSKAAGKRPWRARDQETLMIKLPKTWELRRTIGLKTWEMEKIIQPKT